MVNTEMFLSEIELGEKITDLPVVQKLGLSQRN
jgi:hypothetical protein